MTTTNRELILCADEESLMHPELLGLDGENIAAQTWLKVFSDAQQVRDYVKNVPSSLEVWVAGSDEMEAINLAAALKYDRCDAEVNLVSFVSNGSLLSRARAAGITEILDKAAFLHRYKVGKSTEGKDAAPNRFVSPTQTGAFMPQSVSSAQPAIAQNAALMNHTMPAFAAGQTQSASTPAPAALRAQDPGALFAAVPLQANVPEVSPLAPPRSPGQIAWQGQASPLSSATQNGSQATGLQANGSQAPVAPPLQAASWNQAGGMSTPSAGSIVFPCGSVSRGSSFVLSVVGAGGGAGKSTVALLCACQAQKRGLKTVLLDADLQFGDLAYLCGSETALHADDLIEAPLRIQGLQGDGKLPALIAAPRRLERSELVAASIGQLIEALKTRFDVVVINTGANWSDLHVQLLETSSNTLFVLDQRPSSIRACKHALDLCSRCGVASKPFVFAINHCARKALFSAVDVSNSLQGARVYELAEGGREVEELLGSGRVSTLLESKNPLLQSIDVMLEELLPKSSGDKQFHVPAEEKRGFGRFKRRSK